MSKAAGWGKEPKPTLEQVCSNHAVLLALADIADATLIVIAVDFRYYFHHNHHLKQLINFQM